MYQNVRGLRTKIGDVYLYSASSEHDIILLSESWLTPDIASSEVFCNLFKVYRMDRNSNTSDKQRGGGVLIAVKTEYDSSLVPLEGVNVEHVFVKVRVGNGKFVFGCVYIPPRSDIAVYSGHVQVVGDIMRKHGDHTAIIVGDYNLPNLVWNCNYEGAMNVTSDVEALLCDEFSLLGLTQRNYVCNVNDSVLDLCFSNCYMVISRCEPLTTCDGYHPPLESVISLNCQSLNINGNVYHNFRKADYGGLNNYLLHYNWVALYSLKDINDIVDKFYEILYEAIDRFVPRYRRKTDPHYPVWFSSDLKRKVIAKKAAHKMYKSTGYHHHYVKFCNLRNECKELTRTCYKQYITRMEHRLRDDVGEFWKFVRDKTGKKNGAPQSMFLGDEVAEGGEQVTELFASHFKAVYEGFNARNGVDRAELQDAGGGLVDGINVIEIVFDRLLDVLLSLNVNKGAGPDMLPNLLLRECAVSLCEPLLFIFNKSLSQGIFPDRWRHSFLSPVFKSGNNCDVNNYRPVCIQSAIPKVLERMVAPVLESSFRNIIVENQHGFVGGRSTVTNLFSYTDFIGQSLDEGYEVHAIYTDFSKAFDLLDQSVLECKIRGFGINGAFASWLSSYLHNRTLQVRMNGFLSSEIRVVSGVPQGSHLGPKLFLLLINDIGQHFKSEYLLFADDLKIFRCIRSEQDCNVLQEDVNGLLVWCDRNNLRLNYAKCCCMVFSRSRNSVKYPYKMGDTLLAGLTVVRDLGVNLDGMLHYRDHIEAMLCKANRMLGLVIRMSGDLEDLSCVVTLFKSCVRSVLEYGATIWSPFYEIHKHRIESVQTKFLRYLRYRLQQRRYTLDISAIRELFGLSMLENRRKYLDMCFIFNIINGIINSSHLLGSISFSIPARDLRRYPLLSSKTCHSRHAQNMPMNRLVNYVNEHVDIDFIGTSCNKFRRRLRERILK